jgi:UPF0755 protein
MKMLRDLLLFVAVLISISLVVGVFFFIYSALSPSKPEEDNGGVLVRSAPFPTAVSLEDVPLGLFLQQHQDELNTPAGNDPTPMSFTVLPGELPTDVAGHLQKQGLIKSADLFVQWVKYRHIGNKIQAGEYALKSTMTIDEIAEALQHGRAKTISVSIRPGWRAEEVADYIATLGLVNVSKDQFLAAVKSGKYDYAFLRDRPKTASASLEGFLFPETYNVPFDTSVDTLMTIILNTFDQRVTAKMRQEATASKMSMYEVMTLAAIVEREAAVASERPTIASVYLNRIKKKQFLQADPTVQYAMGYQAATKQWWKSPVTLDEYQNVNSPYNTYLHGGLPPGPICNPSLAAIQAVLEPDQTDYLFFLGKGDGSHVFAKTYDEHQQNMQKYGYK